MLDSSSIANALNISQPAEVYHLSAQSFVGVSFSQPFYTTNVTALVTVRMLDEIKKTPSKKSFKWSAMVEVERDSFDKDKDIIIVRLLNTTSFKGKKPKYEVFLFNCKLEIELSSIPLSTFK